MEKTNVMRILSQKKTEYVPREYPSDITEGVKVAEILGEPAERVFKTLVTAASTGEHLVFVIPVAESLDLKKAARSAGVKSLAMIKQKELLPLTGYIHGGCSPIGMKKQFRTFIHDAAEGYETFFVSAGRVGAQIEIAPHDLACLVGAEFCDLTV